MQLGQDAGGHGLTGYQQRALGIAPPVNPMLLKMLLASGQHVSGYGPVGGVAQRMPRTARPVGPQLRSAHPAPDLSAMGGGLNAIPGPALEGGPTFGQGMDELHYAGPEGRAAQPGPVASQQAALRARLAEMQMRQAYPVGQGPLRGAHPAQPVMHPQDQQRVATVAQKLMQRLAMHRQLQGLLNQQRSAYPVG